MYFRLLHLMFLTIHISQRKLLSQPAVPVGPKFDLACLYDTMGYGSSVQCKLYYANCACNPARGHGGDWLIDSCWHTQCWLRGVQQLVYCFITGGHKPCATVQLVMRNRLRYCQQHLTHSNHLWACDCYSIDWIVLMWSSVHHGSCFSSSCCRGTDWVKWLMNWNIKTGIRCISLTSVLNRFTILKTWFSLWQ